MNGNREQDFFSFLVSHFAHLVAAQTELSLSLAEREFCANATTRLLAIKLTTTTTSKTQSTLLLAFSVQSDLSLNQHHQ